MKLKIADIIDDSVVDGEGYRLAVFTQGCQHNCPECHNPQSHDMNAGRWVEIEDILKIIKDNPLLSGVTFSGGEPFLQPKPLTMLAKKIHELNLNIWCYTGFTYEELCMKNNKDVDDLLENIDILVDGKFIVEQRDLSLLYRGSSNQRIIDLKTKRKEGFCK